MDKHGNALKAMGWARTLPVSSGVRAGRAWARRHLDELGWTRHAPEAADAVVLTVSELITNAHVHARSDADTVLTWEGVCLYVGVHDDSPQLPRPREASSEAASGRGMHVADALADDRQARPDARGTTVTACFHPPGPARPLGAGAGGPAPGGRRGGRVCRRRAGTEKAAKGPGRKEGRP